MIVAPYSAALTTPGKQVVPSAPSFDSFPHDRSEEEQIAKLRGMFHQCQDLTAALSGHLSRHAEVAAELVAAKGDNTQLLAEVTQLKEVAEGDKRALVCMKEAVETSHLA